MEDSQIAALPPDLAAEAQSLRREWESRNRHIQDRFFNQGGASALSTILRTTAGAGGGDCYLQSVCVMLVCISNIRKRGVGFSVFFY